MRTHQDLSGHANTWARFRRMTGMAPTAEPDQWHVQTRQPDPGAMSYAYTPLQLEPFSPIGAGIWNRRNFEFAVPYSIQPLQVGTNGLGGITQGNPLVTQLLLSQGDAVARGLRAAGQPVPAGVGTNG